MQPSLYCPNERHFHQFLAIADVDLAIALFYNDLFQVFLVLGGDIALFVLRAFGPTVRIAGFTGLETRLVWRLAVADFIIGFLAPGRAGSFGEV